MVLCNIMLNSFHENKLAGLITIYVMLFVAYRFVPIEWVILQRLVSISMLIALAVIAFEGTKRLFKS